MDDDDLFGEALTVEQDSIDKGRADGLRDGMLAGIVEGRELGVQKGYEIGSELGFYAGCVNAWRQLQARDPALIPERAARGVAALEEMIGSFPLCDPHDESLQDRMERLRGRFKATASLLGCLQDYFPSAPAQQQQQQQQQQAGQTGSQAAAGAGSSSGAAPPPSLAF